MSIDHRLRRGCGGIGFTSGNASFVVAREQGNTLGEEPGLRREVVSVWRVPDEAYPRCHGARAAPPEGPVQLRLTRRGTSASFAMRSEGHDWEPVLDDLRVGRPQPTVLFAFARDDDPDGRNLPEVIIDELCLARGRR